MTGPPRSTRKPWQTKTRPWRTLTMDEQWAELIAFDGNFYRMTPPAQATVARDYFAVRPGGRP